MTSISALNSTLPTVLTPVGTTLAAQNQAVASTATDTPAPAAIVTLGQNTSIGYAETYTARGSVTGSDTKVVQESEGYNKVTYAMLSNLDSSSTSGRFRGVGAALLQQLAEGKSTSISQSLLKAGSSNTAAVTAAQSDLHTKSPNTFTLTLKMASGATVTLSLAGGSKGLAVQADVSGGKLSSEELNALGALSDSFQNTIDGLSAVPPSLKLGDLAKLDPSMFSSVDLSSSLKLDEEHTQTFSFHADSQSKSISLVGPNGNIGLTVDTKNSAILGTKQQQAEALSAYLDQFDAARQRGEGDENLMSLFKSAFTDLNGSNSPAATAAGAAPQRLNGMTLSDIDHGLLTGLADFSASISQPKSYSNPMQPSEVDKFSYNVSQSSVTKGSNQQNRSVEQNQQSDLSAAFHKNLYPGSTLNLTSDKQTQNYYYTEIEDKASTTTKLAYDKGSLVEASLSQSATQTTRTKKYLLGELQSDIYTPKSVSTSKNMLSIIEAAVDRDTASRRMSGKSTLADDLKDIHSKIFLQPNPSMIRD